MLKSLENFPKGKGTAFSPETYNHELNRDVAVDSPYTGAVGLELELEGVGLPEIYRGNAVNGVTWIPHADGSLRAVGGRGPGGMEYVLNQPCPVGDVSPLVSNLFEYIRDNGGRVQNSSRCSTHAHLNMRGMKINQLCSFVALWGTFENVLANWCGPHRAGNHFALRLSDSDYAVNAWEKAFKTGDFRFSRENRYLALNPACLNTFGSLEIRTMRGVESAEEVEIWVEALMKLRDLAASKDYEDPTAIAMNVSGMGIRPFFESVFGDLRIFETLEQETVKVNEDVEILVREGFRRVQPIIYTLPWQVVLPEISKPFIPNPFGTAKKKVAGVRGRIIEPNPVNEGPVVEWRWDDAAIPVAPAAPRPRRRFERGDRVMYNGAGLGADHLWIGHEATVAEVGTINLRVRFDSDRIGNQIVRIDNVERIG